MRLLWQRELRQSARRACQQAAGELDRVDGAAPDGLQGSKQAAAPKAVEGEYDGIRMVRATLQGGYHPGHFVDREATLGHMRSIHPASCRRQDERFVVNEKRRFRVAPPQSRIGRGETTQLGRRPDRGRVDVMR